MSVAVESKNSFRRLAVACIVSTFAGWVVLMLATALLLFIQARRPDYDSDLGAFDAFILVGAGFSAIFLADAVVLVLPGYLFLRRQKNRIQPIFWALGGGVSFAWTVPLWIMMFGGNMKFQAVVAITPVAFAAGSTCYYVLWRSRFGAATVAADRHGGKREF